MESLGVLPAGVAAEVAVPSGVVALPRFPLEAAVAYLVEKRAGRMGDERLRRVEDLAGGDGTGSEDSAAG